MSKLSKPRTVSATITTDDRDQGVAAGAERIAAIDVVRGAGCQN